MATFIAVLSLVLVVLCLPLVLMKPKWVLYACLTAMVFHSIIAGYIEQAGNLGMPRTWAPADLLMVLTLFAAFFVGREKLFPSDLIAKCLVVLGLMSGLAILMGLFYHSDTLLRYLRVTFFVPVMYFAIRYFRTPERVNEFFKFITILLLVMFGVHVLIRFELYTPLSAEGERAVMEGGLAGERGVASLIPLLYYIIICNGLGRLTSKTGNWIVSMIMMLVGVAGIVLSETRSMYGVLAVMIVMSLLVIRQRAKAVVVYSLVGFVVVFVALAVGFDFLARFRADYGRSQEFSIDVFGGKSWRLTEPKFLVDSYRDEAVFLLTGRGIGALHPAPAGEAYYVGYYHSEYLGWMDRCGLIGFVAVIVMVSACLWRSFTLSRSHIPQIQRYGTMLFLLTTAFVTDGFFHPVLSHVRAASVIVCFFAIIANWRYLCHDYEQLEWEDAAECYEYDQARPADEYCFS